MRKWQIPDCYIEQMKFILQFRLKEQYKVEILIEIRVFVDKKKNYLQLYVFDNDSDKDFLSICTIKNIERLKHLIDPFSDEIEDILKEIIERRHETVKI